MKFSELNQLRLTLEGLLRPASDSLELYSVENGGFVHRMAKVSGGKFSMASTATVVAFLTKTGRWGDPLRKWSGKETELARAFIASKWDSSDLGADNPFTTAFMLEAIHNLDQAGAKLTSANRTKVGLKKDGLLTKLLEGKGLSVKAETPTAFMTYKGLTALEHDATPERFQRASDAQREWVWNHLLEESVAISSGRPEADVFELGYSILAATKVTDQLKMTPRRRDSVSWALKQFFAAQTDKGLWPRSQPLFHYPRYGDAYSYDFEFLTELLGNASLEEALLPHLTELAGAAYALEQRRILLNRSGAVGWSSGHLKETLSEPESWSTASVYHFCHSLHRLVIEAIRRELFEYVGAPYSRSLNKRGEGKISPVRFLDSPIEKSDKSVVSLRTTLETGLLTPLLSGVDGVSEGRDLPTPRAAILYGPPGTSKTQLAEIIAGEIGWPLVKIDPSHLTRDGFDRLHAETNKLFTMLEACEELVVLLDEFDELVRDRDDKGTESESRFLTTAMLPKLTALYEKKKIIYLLATNHVERFDPAIARQGRFDMIVPVMPPTLEEKFRKWPDVEPKLAEHSLLDSSVAGKENRQTLESMTFAEFGSFRSELKRLSSKSGIDDLVKAFKGTITMNALDDSSKSWADRISDQKHRIRIPS